MARVERWRKKQEWLERLARYARGKTTVGAFCAGEGVSMPAFYAWRRRLAVDAAQPAPVAAGQQHGSFAAVRVTGAIPERDIVTVWLRGGTRLEIALADPAMMGTVMAAILSADAEPAGGRP